MVGGIPMEWDDSPEFKQMNDEKLEEYILLVLSDSNLPTGGFVASSGLESYWAHGLLQTISKNEVNGTASINTSSSVSNQMVAFISASLDTYGHTIAAFLLDTHKITYDCIHSEDDEVSMEKYVDKIESLDLALHSMMLNHVAQRASKAQGVALLTLYAKSFSPQETIEDMADGIQPALRSRQRGYTLLQLLKTRIRRGTCHGHLPICWAAFMAVLGIQSSQKALAVHLFLQARAILSSAVRLNIIGPYLSHRLLAFGVRRTIEETMTKVQHATTIFTQDQNSEVDKTIGEELAHSSTEFGWNWLDDSNSSFDHLRLSSTAPKTTWPLGDLLQGRHDQLHSRLFNS